MNIIERTCVTIRHSAALVNAGWLWSVARPIYDSVVKSIARRGLERVINGTDRILLEPKYRGLGEVYEPEVWNHLMSNARTGDVIVDVGAHVGLYALALAKRVTPHGRVVAFEPDERSFCDLMRHVDLNGLNEVIGAVRAAVGTFDGEVAFTCDEELQNRITTEANVNSTTVRSVTLDSFFKGQHLDILKVDVEGFEEDVLKGGRELLMEPSRSPRLIYLEVHPYNWHLCGTTSESLLGRLGEANYEVQTPDAKPCNNIVKYGEVIARRRNR